MRINIHITPTHVDKHASRIYKETQTIAETGIADKVIIIGKGNDILTENEIIDDKRFIYRVKLPKFGLPKVPGRGFLQYLYWLFKIYKDFKDQPVSMINCHQISALFLCVLLKKSTKAVLIYDTHELETEIARYHGISKKILKLVEQFSIRYCDFIFVVSPGIEKWYRKEYQVTNIATVRNIPDFYPDNKRNNSNLLKQKFNIPDSSMVFIYLGVVGYGRFIEGYLDVFSKMGIDKHIVVIGNGPLAAKIKDYEVKFSNIHYLEAVRPDQIQQYTQSADVGLSIIENVSLSYYHCLPNKVFEYILSGLPVISSNFPDLEEIIVGNDYGWICEVNSNVLHNLINSITYSDVLEKKMKGFSASKTISWQIEKQILINNYKEILS
jgi:glycosyltransferase involved in cell wall biosynthesis